MTTSVKRDGKLGVTFLTLQWNNNKRGVMVQFFYCTSFIALCASCVYGMTSGCAMLFWAVLSEIRPPQN